MSSPRRSLSQDGFTLVEVVVAMAILVMACSMALSVLLVTQAGSRSASKSGERSQVLRAAMNQIADDLTYATGDGDPLTLGQCCKDWGTPSQFSVYVYQTRTATDFWREWVKNDGWPGWLTVSRSFWVTYRLEDGNLIRIVHEAGDPNVKRVYVYQVLASGLDTSQSAFAVDQTKGSISVLLRTVETEGVPRVEVAGQWLIRQLRKR